MYVVIELERLVVVLLDVADAIVQASRLLFQLDVQLDVADVVVLLQLDDQQRFRLRSVGPKRGSSCQPDPWLSDSKAATV
eukprot:9745527-Heterocapsa_arctica.AAC.1